MLLEFNPTLIAAGLAAVTSTLSVILTIVFRRAAEDRAAYRRTFEPYLHDLGDSMYQLVATCTILAKKDSGAGWENWLVKAERERDRLQAIRPQVRYPLWGIDFGIRTLTRLPGWVGHKSDSPEDLNNLIDTADSLRRRIDQIVMNCFHKGRPPSHIDRWMVNRIARSMYKIFDDQEKEIE